MYITVHYILSEAGRKASLLAAGNGKRDQEIVVGPNDPQYAAVVAAVKFGYDDRAYVSAATRKIYDVIPTVAQILDDLAAETAGIEAEKTAKAEAIRHAALEVLKVRETKESINYGIRVLAPAWPYGAPSSVTESPEALTWQIELDAINATAKADFEAEQVRINEANAAQKAAAVAQEAARRAALGLADGEIDLDIEDGALTDVPPGMWESHSRGKNWMALIATNPASPGGLDRQFFEKAKGDSYYVVPLDSLNSGDAIEFGADYYSGRGRKSSNRWYGYVVRVIPETDDMGGSLILRAVDGGKTAIKLGQKFAASLVTA